MEKFIKFCENRQLCRWGNKLDTREPPCSPLTPPREIIYTNTLRNLQAEPLDSLDTRVHLQTKITRGPGFVYSDAHKTPCSILLLSALAAHWSLDKAGVYEWQKHCPCGVLITDKLQMCVLYFYTRAVFWLTALPFDNPGAGLNIVSVVMKRELWRRDLFETQI